MSSSTRSTSCLKDVEEDINGTSRMGLYEREIHVRCAASNRSEWQGEFARIRRQYRHFGSHLQSFTTRLPVRYEHVYTDLRGAGFDAEIGRASCRERV